MPTRKSTEVSHMNGLITAWFVLACSKTEPKRSVIPGASTQQHVEAKGPATFQNNISLGSDQSD